MTVAANTGLDLLVEGQASAEITVNELTVILDALMPLTAKSITVSTTPASPIDGDVYIVPSAGWSSSYGNSIAIYFGGWIYVTPKAGWTFFIVDTLTRQRFNGTTWSELSIKGVKTVSFFTEVDNGTSLAATSIDWTVGQKQKVMLGVNTTFTFAAPLGPCNVLLKVVQDSTGGRTATWPTNVKWIGGAAPTLSTGAGAIDIVSFYFDGVNYLAQAGLNFS